MKAIVHIGTAKTGSSTIQRSLNHNRKQLAEYGYHYVSSLGNFNHRLLQIMCERNVHADKDDYFAKQEIYDDESAKKFIEKAEEDLREELLGLPNHIHTVIFSSEHFHSRLYFIEEVEQLKIILSNYFNKFEIIVFLRHQADVVESLYSTVVKSGMCLPFVEFVENRCKPNSPYFSYKDMLDRWSSVFGRKSMIVRLFRKDLFINNDLLTDFFEQIERGLIKNLDTKNLKPENRSLSFWGLYLAKAVNNTLCNNKTTHVEESFRKRIISLLEKQFPGKGEKLSVEEWNKIDEIYFKQNQQIQKNYFPDCKEIFLKREAPKQVRPAVEADFQLRLNKVVNMMLTTNMILNSEQNKILREAAKAIENDNPVLANNLLELVEESNL